MENRLKKYNVILKKHFGYESLKKEQFDIIDKVIHDKKDICAVLATGFGKSLPFQMCHLISKKSVIVISPLISLMNDQMEQLKKINIPVCVLNGTNKNKTFEKNEILFGENKIIYITPEYLEHCEHFIKQLDENDSLSLICIDESHCCSVWSDFRKSYTKLGIFKQWVPDIPIIALTATASKKVRDDICQTLCLKDPHIIIGSFDRPNLYIQITQKTKNIEKDISGILNKFKNEYVIIYCKTRDDTDNITQIVNKIGVKCLAYHAGLSNKERENAHNQFISGDIKLIVATVAFGMGINKSCVRCLIHYGCPKNIEDYYQCIGRAGRDGLPSECHLFYSNKDFIQNKLFLSEIIDEQFKKYQEEQIKNIEKYVFTTDCRRILLLKSFDQNYDKLNCNNCDNCKYKQNIKLIDFTVPCYQLLTLSNVLDGKCGGSTLINILRGSNSKYISDFIKKNRLYGIGKHKSLIWWKAVLRILINNDFLEETHFGKFGISLKCSSKGSKWLKIFTIKYKKPEDCMDNENKILLPPTDDYNIAIGLKSVIPIDNILDPNDEQQLDDVLDDLPVTSEFKNLIKVDLKKNDIQKNDTINDRKLWTQEEDDKLLNNITKHTVIELANLHNRTVGAIRSRIKLIVYRLHKKKLPLELISNVTKLSVEKINDIIKKKKEKLDNKKIIVRSKKL